MRRKHILGLGLLGALAAVLIVAGSACKSSTTAVNPPEEKSFISTSTDNHTHGVQVTRLAIESTPADGYSHATSLVNSHVHTFTMSQAQLLSVKNGATVDIVTSTDSTGHTHTFTIQKWF
jgi:hypothetical protein